MAMIEVDTLIDDCWRDCDDFAVEIENFIGDGKIWHRVVKCAHVDRCRRIGRMVEMSMKGATDE